MLSVTSPESFTLAVVTGDDKTLQQAPGVGKKMAQRMILELKDKLGGLTEGGVISGARCGRRSSAGDRAIKSHWPARRWRSWATPPARSPPP